MAFSISSPSLRHGCFSLVTVSTVLSHVEAALDASGKGGKGGGKGDRAQGISQGVDTIGKAMEAARDPAL